MKTFAPIDQKAIGHFIREGYVVYRGVHDRRLIRSCAGHLQRQFDILYDLSCSGEFERDVNGWAISIMDAFARTSMYDAIVTARPLVDLLKPFLGPDIALLGYDALWINVPQDKDPVLLKGQHTDAWTGTSVNTIFAKTFFTPCDEYNGMSVCPRSHLQGMIPVRNRGIDPAPGVTFDSVNLSDVRAGDLLIWHPLLIHSTTGHSDKNTRISMTSRYTSTESAFSSQERALGYRTVNVGPLNQILRLIGNDYLTPFRTEGGYVGIDRRMAAIYEHSDYKVRKDYGRYL